MKCKKCQINLSKKPKMEHRPPEGIPVSKEMRDTVEKLRRMSNARGRKTR